MGKVTNCHSSKPFTMVEIKELTKKLGVTINDVIMCATSTAIKQYLKSKGDPLGSIDDSDERSKI